MNIENVRELAKIFSANGLTSLEVCEGDTRIKLEKSVAQASNVPTKNINISNTSNVELVASEENGDKKVKSPLVGVFYSSPTPDSEPFVTIGSKVKKGDVLCIIEAMKLMNEIAAEEDGEIVDICIKNGDIAEFGQVLFKTK